MAGASMKDIKLRIKSVESTMQITKAMQLVATSKLRRAKERMAESKPYTAISQEALSASVANLEDKNVPFVAERGRKRRCYVVIAGDRGLAGGYNAAIFKALFAHTEGIDDYCALPLGRKAVDRLAHKGVELLSDKFVRIEGTTVSTCFALSKMLVEGYLSEQYDEVWLVYTSFESMMSQEVKIDRLLPIEKPDDDTPARPVTTVYELSAEETLSMIVPDFLAGRLYSAICDSTASEIAARRTAMDSATKNAGEMINSLKLKFNRARQGAITQEITEIVAGAEQ